VDDEIVDVVGVGLFDGWYWPSTGAMAAIALMLKLKSKMRVALSG
jgi:hypothetical protein